MRKYVISILIAVALVWGTNHYMYSSKSEPPATVNTSSDLNSNENTIADVRADDGYIDDLISSYESNWVSAINEKDFSLIQKLFLQDSKASVEQKNQYDELTSQDAALKLLDFDMSEVKETTADHYEVSITETLSTTIDGHNLTRVNYKLVKIIFEKSYSIYDVSDNSPMG